MTTTTAPAAAESLVSPGSLQLRLGRGGVAAALRLRLRPPHRRLRLRIRPTAAVRRTRAEASPDSFAGWSEDGGGEQEKGGIGGFLGAGLAGVFFAAGVTFAALSLKGKSTYGSKPQMEPLATDQVVTICSDDTSKDDNVGDSYDEVLLNNDSKNDSSLEYTTGIDKDLSLVENNDASCKRGSDIKHDMEPRLQTIKPAPDDVNATAEKATQDDDLIAQDVIDNSPPEVSNSNSLEVSEAPVDFVADTPSKDTDNNVDSGTLESPIALDVDINTLAHQEGAINPEERINSEVPSPFPSVSENQHPVETLTSSVIVLESGDVVPIQGISQTATNSASTVLKAQDIEQNDNVQLSAKSSRSYPELRDEDEDEHSPFSMSTDLDDLNSSPAERSKLDNGAQTRPHFLSDLNETETELEKRLDKGQLFESVEHEKSFSPAGIPAPSLLSAALQVPPGEVLVPAAVDQTQGNALAALQVMKVIESDAQPGDLCTRREYARWLVVGSNCLSRNTISKVYPAMYIENMTELAFDDVTPEDPDFPCIQGLAEAGLIASKLSRSDMNISENGQKNYNLFFPESPLSRQDLVSWKMALEKRQLPEVDRNSLYRLSGYIDIDKINTDAWPALAADLGAGEQSITALAFGFTRLFQPDKPVTKGQAALALATGDAAEVVSEELARIEAEKMAEAAVNAHSALVAQVENDFNASFERELAKEREKIETLEKLAEEARMELEKLRTEREEENNALIRGRAAVESEKEVLSKLRCEVEEQLQSVMSNKVEISFEKDRISKLHKELENENQAIVQLQYELEVERKALSMARAWAEEEAKRAREQARALEEARYQWERQGVKVIVDGDLQEDASTGITWVNVGKEHPVDETINRAESLVKNLKSMAAEMKVKSSSAIKRLIQHITSFLSTLRLRAAEVTEHCGELATAAISRARKSVDQLRGNASALGSTIGDRARKVVEDCKEGLGKITQRFKTD